MSNSRRAGGKGRKRTKAAAAASQALGGRETTPEQAVSRSAAGRTAASQPWLSRPVMGTRLTWRVVLLFLLTCVMLDVFLWGVFEFGFGQCYGVLCLL